MLDLAEVALPSELAPLRDFWLIDQVRVCSCITTPTTRSRAASCSISATVARTGMPHPWRGNWAVISRAGGPITRSIGARRPDRGGAPLIERSSPDELSATLRRLRHEAGLSESEAARRAGLTQSKVSRVETARQMPTAAEVERLARCTRCRRGLDVPWSLSQRTFASRTPQHAPFCTGAERPGCNSASAGSKRHRPGFAASTLHW